MHPINNNTTSEKKFSSLDWTAGAATAIPTALSFYAFNAASKSQTTVGMLFHTAIGLFSLKYAYGFASSWKENKDMTTKERYITKALYNADNIQTDVLAKASSLYNSIISPSQTSKLQDIAKQALDMNRKDYTT